MRWITGIKINNYRAFKGSYPFINIPPNSHVLIYGENGSGKSSIYNALKDFFKSSTDNTIRFKVNLFSQLEESNTGIIDIRVSELDLNKKKIREKSYQFTKPDSQSSHRVQSIQLANKVNGFLDYKRILETYHFEYKALGNPNLFWFIVEDLLSEHLITRSDGGVAMYPLGEEWNRIKTPIYNLDRRYADHQSAIKELPKFEQNLSSLLTKVFSEFRRIVKVYFDPKLDIDVTFSKMEMDYKKWGIREELILDIKYAGKSIPSYETFLNEARLSAIGISIYLAALKTYPLDASDLRVLYLDDIFIGLDTNNRIPLLKILKKEFIDIDFQIFISTYDRQWFELARAWFDAEKCQFKCLELFVDDAENNPLLPDIPIVIDPSNDLFDYAKKYFEKKDYAAAANYLRKCCEAELKRILPKNLILKIDHNTDEVVIHKLENLITNFFTFLDNNNLSNIEFRHFRTYKKIIFNPFSHDDLEAPHYRSEIQDCIDLVTELQKLKTKEIIHASESPSHPLKLGIRFNNGGKTIQEYQFIVLENLQIIKQNLSQIRLSKTQLKVISVGKERIFDSIYQAFDQIKAEKGYPISIDYEDFYNNIKVTTRKKLIDLMAFD